MKHTSQHFFDKTVDLGESDRLGFRGAIAMVLGGEIASIMPSRIRPCFDDHLNAHGFEYHEVKTVCLSSV